MNLLLLHHIISFTLIVALLTPLAGFIYSKNPRSSLNRSFALYLGTVSWWALFTIFMITAPTSQIGLFWDKLCLSGVVFIPSSFFHFTTSFLENIEKPRRIVAANYALSWCFLAALWATSLFVQSVTPKFGLNYFTVPGPLYLIFIGFFSISVYGAISLMGLALRRTSPSKYRSQLQYFFWSSFVAFTAGACNYLLVYNIRVPGVAELSNYGLLLYVMSIAWIIFRYQFLDVRLVIRRSVVYSLLIACITATYLVMVMVTERWFQGFFGYRSIFATTIIAFLIAVFFNPLRDRIQTFVDRALFKATPAELAEQREQLLTEVRKGEQMKAVATLAAGLAHEIKNPLASIKTFTEYLSTRHDDPEFRAKFQKIVGGEVERINLIVQQLLEFAKPVPPKLTPLEIPRLVDETLEFLSGELVERQVEVNRRYEARPRVLGDPQQLKQVFLNLFLNSLQAMNGHGRLEIRTSVEGSEIIVTITDSGSGIAPKDLPHVFEPFYTTKTNGTGLGLAVVQGIIKEHGGRIAVESHPGQGTTMRLHLPIAM